MALLSEFLLMMRRRKKSRADPRAQDKRMKLSTSDDVRQTAATDWSAVNSLEGEVKQ